MGSRFSYLRHEKTARTAELLLKQKVVRSNHELACLAALEADDRLDVASALRAFIANDPGDAHREAFSRNTHQKGKRMGVDVPAALAATHPSPKGEDEPHGRFDKNLRTRPFPERA